MKKKSMKQISCLSNKYIYCHAAILINLLLMTRFPWTGSCAQHGYRSNGTYVDGWFGGRCGSGHPFYLMCPDCRERYLEARGNRENLLHSVESSDSQSSLKAPDLLEFSEQACQGNKGHCYYYFWLT